MFYSPPEILTNLLEKCWDFVTQDTDSMHVHLIRVPGVSSWRATLREGEPQCLSAQTMSEWCEEQEESEQGHKSSVMGTTVKREGHLNFQT